MSNIRLSTNIVDMIENPISSVRSDLDEVSSYVSTLDTLLVDTRDKLEKDKAELLQEQEKLRQQSYVTTDQLKKLVQHQLTTLDATIVGFTTCKQLATNINNQLNKKVQRLTRLTALLGLLSIAALIIAFMR